MDLDFDISTLTQPGRRPEPVEAEVVRELRQADFALLTENRSIKPIPILKVTERHHALARMLSQGSTPSECAIALGYTKSRISVLRQSSAFKELEEIYSDVKDQEFTEVAAKMAGISKDALILIQERLEEKPEDFSNKELREVATAFTDRTGHGPTSSQVNLNINANMGDRLEAARARARESAMGKIIDVTPEVVK